MRKAPCETIVCEEGSGAELSPNVEASPRNLQTDVEELFEAAMMIGVENRPIVSGLKDFASMSNSSREKVSNGVKELETLGV